MVALGAFLGGGILPKLSGLLGGKPLLSRSGGGLLPTCSGEKEVTVPCPEESQQDLAECQSRATAWKTPEKCQGN